MIGEYEKLIPDDFRKNLQWRNAIIRASMKSERLRQELWCMCSRDLLFWVKGFVWTHDPRRKPAVLPMVPWPYQKDALAQFEEAISEQHDVLVEKSRDMGASWLGSLAMLHQWQFVDMRSFLLVSRKEELVDKPGDPKALMWRLDFVLKFQPSWMVPPINRSKLHIENLANGSTIDGEATTGDVARGNRHTAIFHDEFASVPNDEKTLASTADATDCRIFNSTPKGVGNAFYRLSRSGIRTIRMHWSQHPVKARGLYRDEDGRLRSPWYDKQCKRRSQQEIAQELDIDYLGADFQFMDTNVADQIRRETGRSALWVGQCLEGRLVETGGKNGKLRLWTPVVNGMPPRGRYVMGVDIAMGTGASNSVIAVSDMQTGESVAEFCDSRTKPHELAEQAIDLGKLFTDSDGGSPLLIWERNGPGSIFGSTVMELGYSNLYRTVDMTKYDRRRARDPGFHKSPSSGKLLLERFREGLLNKWYVCRSSEAIDELKRYVYTADQKIVHAESVSSIDPSGARDSHGDRVIAHALCFFAIYDRGRLRREQGGRNSSRVILPGSLAWRRRERKKKANAGGRW
ncbi:MAG: terminase family protein [Planctomycetota bacterium]